jgi:DNA-binding response OmpR family regulator
MRVLVVEDDAELAETLAVGLRREGMAIDVTGDGYDALDRLELVAYDVVVLDRDLPGLHGDQVCRAIVADGRPSRVLMLTAAGTIGDRVEGLGLGADDYLPKPFAFAELVARIRALGRRAGPPRPPILQHGDLRLDPALRVATRAGARLPLTPKELGVLELLLAAAGRHGQPQHQHQQPAGQQPHPAASPSSPSPSGGRSGLLVVACWFLPVDLDLRGAPMRRLRW